ncbi:Cupin domain-containing protein [Cladophialophora immunda]|nr:Cupin domain-containing protein [Cladophialophora immunda]
MQKRRPDSRKCPEKDSFGREVDCEPLGHRMGASLSAWIHRLELRTMGSAATFDRSQISPLPPVHRHITTHDPKTGKAIFYSTGTASWNSSATKDAAASVAYTTSFPPQLSGDEDIEKHNALMVAGGPGLVVPSGTVCRVVDIGPGREAIMHRTCSLDYGVVVEGTIEMVLDSGERAVMNRGDIVIQRATMHGWRNPSQSQWARLFFVLQDCKALTIGGMAVEEDLVHVEGSCVSGSTQPASLAPSEKLSDLGGRLL